MLMAGDRIQAKLIEEIEKDHWIVSFTGHLVQVRNTTPIEFQEGLKLNLEVIKSRPLQLKVLSEPPARRPGLSLRI